jgi:hypothetical protein
MESSTRMARRILHLQRLTARNGRLALPRVGPGRTLSRPANARRQRDGPAAPGTTAAPERQSLLSRTGEIHWREAVDAFRRYGKGRHRAALNFGDCMTYATARLAGESLSFIGDDFALTDLA